MHISGSQRWAIGAVTLATLIACTPAADQPAENPTAVLSGEIPEQPAAVPPVMAAPGEDPGYWAAWAATTADCGDTTKTYMFSRDVVNLTPQKRNCAVKSADEEHPTGRSAIYTLSAVCVSDPPAAPDGNDTLTLNFGASDTVMQLSINSDPPLTLERCPTVPAP